MSKFLGNPRLKAEYAAESTPLFRKMPLLTTYFEEDIMTFARLTGDFHPLHTDEAYAKRYFGGRIAHGLLNLSLSSGLKVKQAMFRNSLIAFLGMESVRFLKPVLIGDTLHVETEVVDKRETSKGDRGVITTRSLTKNQKGEVVLEEISKLLVAKKSAKKA